MQLIMRRGRWVGAVAALLTPLCAVAPASAATTSKPYSLTITRATPTYETSAGPANNEVASGETVGITATFTNEANTQQIGSANLFWPSGFNVVSASVLSPGTASVAANCALNGSPAGPCVQVRSLALAPGGSVTVTMSVATPTGHPGNSDAWQAEVKQANNFSGTPGNDFFLDSGTSQLFTFLDGAASLAFVKQPHNEILGSAIDGATDWFTGGAAASTSVTVDVLAADGTVVSGFAAPVTAAIAVNPGGGMLSGTNPQTASSGIAAFNDLQVSAPANGYELSASSGTLSPATSAAFDAQGTFASCSGPGNSCHTDQAGSGGDASLAATVVSGSGLLLESANANNGAQLTCSGSTSIDPNTYTFLTTGDLVASKVATITMLGVTINGSVTKFLHAQQVCFGATVDFVTASGALAPSGVLPDGSSGYIGLLPDCTGSTAGPCHDQNSDSATLVGSTYTVRLVADIPAAYAGDPWMH